MALNLANYQKKASESVKAFWGNRDAAHKKQIEAGKSDAGSRGAVTGGKNMDGFVALLIDLIKANGLKDATIIREGRIPLTLPGYFRPTKMWDMLVLRENRLVAAIELESQVGSFGNNFNNRTEEAIGTAHDLWTAYREGSFGESPRPFVGWLMLVEDAPRSRSPIRDNSMHFPIRPEFQGASYIERYNILCKKLVQEQLYTTTAVLASTQSAIKTGKFSDVSEMTSLKSFVSSFAGHIAAEAVR
jgi:Restriction endonuclease XhoI